MSFLNFGGPLFQKNQRAVSRKWTGEPMNPLVTSEQTIKAHASKAERKREKMDFSKNKSVFCGGFPLSLKF